MTNNWKYNICKKCKKKFKCKGGNKCKWMTQMGYEVNKLCSCSSCNKANIGTKCEEIKEAWSVS